MSIDEHNEGEIDLRLLLGVVWRQRKFAFAGMAVCLVLMIVFLHTARYAYSVTIEIAPVVSDSTAKSAGVLRALTSITGSGMGTGDNFQMVIDGLKSEAAAQALSKNTALMRRIFAGEWDPQTHAWREPGSYTRWLTHGIKHLLGLPVQRWQPPSAPRLYQYLQGRVNVIEDVKSSVVTLEIDDPDPKLAADVLIALNKSTDDVMRARALSRADGYIAYIMATLNTTTVSEYRQALLDNLNEQTKMRMMAAANVAFASAQFSGPVIAPTPKSPPAMFLLIFSIIAGSLIGGALGIAAERYGWVFPSWVVVVQSAGRLFGDISRRRAGSRL